MSISLQADELCNTDGRYSPVPEKSRYYLQCEALFETIFNAFAMPGEKSSHLLQFGGSLQQTTSRCDAQETREV